MPVSDVDNVRPSPASTLFTGSFAIQLVRILVQLHKNTRPLDVSRPICSTLGSWGLTYGIFTRSFPNAVPSGTRVPQWALQDNTVRSLSRTFPKPSLTGARLLPQNENLWNATTAFTIGGE